MSRTLISLAIRFLVVCKAALRSVEGIFLDLVLAWAPDAVLAGYNDSAYGPQTGFRGDRSDRREDLFPWERAAVERFFPPAPARVLIGGVGGGREAFALARLGYRVVAFDPSPTLTDSMLAGMDEGAGIEVYRGAYEHLPRVEAVGEELEKLELTSLPAFDAAIIGWGSFAHLRTDEDRLHTLRSFRQLTEGPVLLSWIGRLAPLSSRRMRLRRLLPGRRQRDPQTRFSWYLGFHRGVTVGELEDLLERTDLRLVHLYDEEAESGDAQDPGFPHAVVVPR